MNEKFEFLKREIEGYDDILIPLSGGLDSTFLLFFVREFFPHKQIVGVHFTGETFYEEDGEFVKSFCSELNVRLILEEFKHFSIEGIYGEERCLKCKGEMYKRLKNLMKEKNLKYIFSSEVFDENLDERMGYKFIEKKKEVIFPLLKAKIKKKEIVSFLKNMGRYDLIRNKNSCLLTRFERGVRVDENLLNMVKLCERYLRSLGFKKEIRIRVKSDKSSIIELSSVELSEKCFLLFNSDTLKFFLEKGFKKIFLNLRGYEEN